MEPYRHHSRYHLWPTHEGRAAAGTSDGGGIARPASRAPIYSPPPRLSPSSLQQQLPEPQPQPQPQPLPRLQPAHPQHEYHSPRPLPLGHPHHLYYNSQQPHDYREPDSFRYRHHTAEPLSVGHQPSTCKLPLTSNKTNSDSYSHNRNSKILNWRPASTTATPTMLGSPFLGSPFHQHQQEQGETAALANNVMDGPTTPSTSAFTIADRSPGHTASFSGPEDHSPMINLLPGDNVNPVSQEGGVFSDPTGCSCNNHSHNFGHHNSHQHDHAGFVSSLPQNSGILPQVPPPVPPPASSFFEDLAHNPAPILSRYLTPSASLPPRPPATMPMPAFPNMAIPSAYCFDRGGGLFTPLIPADMLPSMTEFSRLVRGCCGMIVLHDPYPTAALQPVAQSAQSYSGLRSTSVVGSSTTMSPLPYMPQVRSFSYPSFGSH